MLGRLPAVGVGLEHKFAQPERGLGAKSGAKFIWNIEFRLQKNQNNLSLNREFSLESPTSDTDV